MHTPVGTLERNLNDSKPPQTELSPNEISNTLSISHKEDHEHFTNSVLMLQDEYHQYMSQIPQAVLCDVKSPAKCTARPAGEKNTPDTVPQPAGSGPCAVSDPKQGWMDGIFGCLRPVLSIIGKAGVNDIKNQPGKLSS